VNKLITYRDLGLIPYAEAWDYQEELFRGILSTKKEVQGGETSNYLLFCEHPHVYTLGKSGSPTNLLVNEEMLAKIGASFYHTNRGGDITYHGPGQIVGYPIIDLENFGLGIRRYVELLEESIICLLKEYGIASSRLEGASGVWLDPGNPSRARKICAIGVRSSRYVTMHGFAFNVNTRLDYYSYINPCGFVEKGVSSMEKELGALQDINAVKSRLKEHLIQMLQSA
jgi:lipoyl(octanoyl) transferase